MLRGQLETYLDGESIAFHFHSRFQVIALTFHAVFVNLFDLLIPIFANLRA